MGDSCSSPRTASSRVSPRRATVLLLPGSLLVTAGARSPCIDGFYRRNLSHRYIDRVDHSAPRVNCPLRGGAPYPVHRGAFPYAAAAWERALAASLSPDPELPP